MKVKLKGVVVWAAPALIQVVPPLLLYSNWTLARPLPPVSEAVAVRVGLLMLVAPDGAEIETLSVKLPTEKETAGEVVLLPALSA